MIEEIKRKLKGDRFFLKCINKEEFISKNKVNREILNLEEIEVQYYQEEGVEAFEGFQLIVDEDFLEDRDLDIDDMFISIDEIAYFEIIESPYIEDNPTFDDLIDVAIQAYKDGVIKSLKLLDYGVHSLSYSVNADANGDENTIFSQHKDYSDGINFINSLYTETFVIESEGDISRIKSGADIELANGNKCTFLNDDDMWRIKDDKGFSHNCGLLVLKGATVTQKRVK